MTESNSEKPEAVDEVRFNIEMLFGRVELEQRYVNTAPGAYECQGRSKHYDRHGALTETTPWIGLSTISNVPANLTYLLR